MHYTFGRSSAKACSRFTLNKLTKTRIPNTSIFEKPYELLPQYHYAANPVPRAVKPNIQTPYLINGKGGIRQLQPQRCKGVGEHVCCQQKSSVYPAATPLATQHSSPRYVIARQNRVERNKYRKAHITGTCWYLQKRTMFS